MSHVSTYVTPFRRRIKQKTNFKKRLALLRSSVPRAVIRKSNNNSIIEIIEYQKKGDKTMSYGISKDLKPFGWSGHTGNISAAYLVGYSVGLKAKQKGVTKAVFDIGLNTPVHKSRIFAGLKGLIDAGIEIPHDESIFPPPERISGSHLKENSKEMFEKVKSEIEKKFGEKKWKPLKEEEKDKEKHQKKKLLIEQKIEKKL